MMQGLFVFLAVFICSERERFSADQMKRGSTVDDVVAIFDVWCAWSRSVPFSGVPHLRGGSMSIARPGKFLSVVSEHLCANFQPFTTSPFSRSATPSAQCSLSENMRASLFLSFGASCAVYMYIYNRRDARNHSVVLIALSLLQIATKRPVWLSRWTCSSSSTTHWCTNRCSARRR